MDAASRVAVLAIGGAMGVNARYWLSVAMDARVGRGFPWATFAINVSGAFALGLLATLMARWRPDHPARLAVLVGFLGGFTTFSTFAMESARLWSDGAFGRSIAYMGGSVAAGFVAVVLGSAVGRLATDQRRVEVAVGAGVPIAEGGGGEVGAGEGD